MLDKFRKGAAKASIQATAFLKEGSNKLANESQHFVQGFTLPGEAEKAAKILESFLGTLIFRGCVPQCSQGVIQLASSRPRTSRVRSQLHPQSRPPTRTRYVHLAPFSHSSISPTVSATSYLPNRSSPSLRRPPSLAPPRLRSPPHAGLAIFSVIKAGFVFSGKAGSGIVIARLPDGSWSAPSCIATGGVGWGLQIGADITDFVIVLNSEEAVRAFAMGGNVTIGGNISAAAGPIGTGGAVQASLAHPAPMFSYSKSKGAFLSLLSSPLYLLYPPPPFSCIVACCRSILLHR